MVTAERTDALGGAIVAAVRGSDGRCVDPPANPGTGAGAYRKRTTLVALLESSSSFRTWCLERVVTGDGTPAPDVAYHGARRSVHHANGESDVVAEWRGADGDVVVLAETKLKVVF